MSIMLSEILSSPLAIKEALSHNQEIILKIVSDVFARKIKNITTISRGSSDNACTFFKYLVETECGIMVSKYALSIATVYEREIDLSDNLVLAVSQSGMSTDTLLSVRKAKQSGAMVVALTNNPDSPLAKECDYSLSMCAGIEKGVASTKTFISQLVVLSMLAKMLAKNPDNLHLDNLSELSEDFIANMSDKIIDIATQNKDIQNVVILTRGLMQGVANELSLKLIETSYKFSRPFSTTDFMHGPLAIIDNESPVILIAPNSVMKDEFIEMATRLSILGAKIISFTDIDEVQSISHFCIKMPPCDNISSSVLYSIAIQLFTYGGAVAQNINPDFPRNLKKVTITK